MEGLVCVKGLGFETQLRLLMKIYFHNYFEVTVVPTLIYIYIYIEREREREREVKYLPDSFR